MGLASLLLLVSPPLYPFYPHPTITAIAVYGGFGATVPFELKIKNSKKCSESLNCRALIDWLRPQFEDEFTKEEGLNWLLSMKEKAENDSATLFGIIVDVLERRGVQVVYESHG